VAVACLLVPACGRAPETPAAEPPSATSVAPGCGNDGHVATELFGAIETRIDWGPGSFNCEGMARPDDEGLRLRLSGNAVDGDLDIIIAVPDLERAAPGGELPTTVTMTVDGSGRFFSTADLETCWADITRNEKLAGHEERYAVAGMIYCVAPLAEIGKPGSITVQELTFASETDWRLP